MDERQATREIAHRGLDEQLAAGRMEKLTEVQIYTTNGKVIWRAH